MMILIRGVLLASALLIVPACGTPGGSSSAPAPADSPAYLIATADDAPPPSPGFIDLGPADDFVPLYNGTVMIGDKSTNEILVLDVQTGHVDARYPLPAPPGALLHDPDRKLVWVSLHSTSALTRIDLAEGTQQLVSLPTVPNKLAMGPAGNVFVSPLAPGSAVAIVDAGTGTATALSGLITGALIAFDIPQSELISAAQGTSLLSRYSYDSSARTLTFQEQIGAGTNGQELALSPDASHLVFACGGGNGPNYSTDDIGPADFSFSSTKRWDTGPFPFSAAFSVDSGRLLMSTQQTLEVFDTSSYAKLQTFTFDLTGVAWPWLRVARWSRGGKLAFGLTDHGTGVRLFWELVAP